MDSVLDEKKKKKKPATAADQADAIDKTNVGGAAKGTSGEQIAKQNIYSPQAQQMREREKAQELVDRDRFTLKTPETTTGTVTKNYEGFGLGGAARVDKLAKEGKSVAEIVKILGLRPKKK